MLSLNYSYFACVSPKWIHGSKCPSGWTAATVTGIGGRVGVGKCFKQLDEIFSQYPLQLQISLTWKVARELCLREGGDLLGVGNDLEGVWLRNYITSFFSQPIFNQSNNRDSRVLFMNLHKKLHCPANGTSEWCWGSRVPQSVFAFPKWMSG